MNEIWDIRWGHIVHSFVQKYTFVIVNPFRNSKAILSPGKVVVKVSQEAHLILSLPFFSVICLFFLSVI